VGKYPRPNSIPKVYPGASAFHHTRQDFPVGMVACPHDELDRRAAERLLK
jgi:hypothetical protein